MLLEETLTLIRVLGSTAAPHTYTSGISNYGSHFQRESTTSTRSTNMHLSYENILQWAFALSPFPSYLPQYFSIIHQVQQSDNNTDDAGSLLPKKSSLVGNVNIGIDRGGDSLRKRNNYQESPTTYTPREMIEKSPISTGSIGLATSKSFEAIVSQNSNESSSSIGEDNKPDAGLSRATVLLLLLAHLLRLLYFHGVVLETERLELTGSSQSSEETLQYDLVGQSMSMIIMQLLLLHAIMLIHRKHLQMNGGIGSINLSTESLLIPPPLSGLPRSTSSFSLSNNNNLSPRNRRKEKWRLLCQSVAAHLRHLYSPYNILQTHSFLKYMELLFLSSLAVRLVFDHHLYPRYGMRIVLGLKHTSIVLESCLALPQTVRNYKKGSTEGLSIVMVVGWFAGDIFKLFYFLFSTIEGKGNGNFVFIMGCLLSISLDSVVGLQMAKTNPEVLEWKKRILMTIGRSDTLHDESHNHTA